MVAVIGLVIAVIALAVPFVIEILKRPRLEVVPVTWRPHRAFPFTFASVGVRNEPLPKLLGMLLSREVAQACEIFIDYYKWEYPDVKLFDSLQGRWDSHPQPERIVRISRDAVEKGVADAGNPDTGVPEERTEFAPSLDPSNQEDIVPGSDRGQGSGGPGESHPRAPTDPCVTVSRYTALVVLVLWRAGFTQAQCAKYRGRFPAASAMARMAFLQDRSFLYFFMDHRSR